MAQRVDMAIGVPVHVHGEAVHREVESSIEVVIAARTSHVVACGFGVVRGRFGLDRPGE